MLELASHCIRCGFCVESCPTFLLTGKETESPRGRIYLMRSAVEGVLDWENSRPHLESCVGCLSCETACPSGVQYGQLIEFARQELESRKPNPDKKWLLENVTDRGKLKRQLQLSKFWLGKRMPGFIAKKLSDDPPEVEPPRRQENTEWPALDAKKLTKSRGEVYLLEGCAMRELFPRVHEATRRLLGRLGFEVRPNKAGCCGSLFGHNGFPEVGEAMAKQAIAEMPPGLPIIINSAGCGSHLKEVFGSVSDRQRIFDLSEFLVAHGMLELLEGAPGLDHKAVYQDPCHLLHGQKIASLPRQLLQAIPKLELIAIPEPDICCGSAGIYNILQPKTARQLGERKYSHMEDSGATLAVTANPGCHAWLDQICREHGGKLRMWHLAEVLESAFAGWPE